MPSSRTTINEVGESVTVLALSQDVYPRVACNHKVVPSSRTTINEVGERVTVLALSKDVYPRVATLQRSLCLGTSDEVRSWTNISLI